MTTNRHDFPGGDRFCVSDVGSTTTKLLLFKKDGDWRFYRAEAPTTVERPHEDVTVGLLAAFRALEKSTGEKLLNGDEPAVPFLTTSSAGGGLAMVVTGLVKNITADSADRVALGAGAVVLDVIAANDGRTAYRKIEDLERLRPDMILLAGGFDGEGITGPVFLAEIVAESGLHPKLNPSARLPVVYAGNVHAREYVEKTLGDRYHFHPVANIRPSGDEENLEPARQAVHRLFMDHVMSQAPGYEKLKSWIAAPILPTPAAFGEILALVSEHRGGKLLAIDIGGATTDVFTAERGRVFRTVSANLGMSYSLFNVVRSGGIESIGALLDGDVPTADLFNAIGNKHVRPTSLPATWMEQHAEWACATVAIREAVRAHLRALAGSDLSLSAEDLHVSKSGERRRNQKRADAPLVLEGYDVVLGSGGILSHSPRSAAAMMLIDALQPRGRLELIVDSAFVMPHLGIVRASNEPLALELFDRVGSVKLGTVVAVAAEPGRRCTIRVRDPFDRTPREVSVDHGSIVSIPLEGSAYLDIERGESDLGVGGGVCGVMLDARPRPVSAGAKALLPKTGLPASTADQPADCITTSGSIRLRRELAIPGEVLVRAGATVDSLTVVARSVRRFLRPFFLTVARSLKCAPEELAGHLVKKVGDEVAPGDLIARRAHHGILSREFRSNVAGTIEKVLPDGTVVVRESPELSAEKTTVFAAKELNVSPEKLRRHLRCRVGQEVERGQWLAAVMPPESFRACASPVRGKVWRIEEEYGAVILEPLLEELEVKAWLPGVVETVTPAGAVIVGRGSVIEGVWGAGGEITGPLTMGEPAAGAVVVRDHADAAAIRECRDIGAAGLVTGGLDLIDVFGREPDFTLVVLQGFGRHPIPPGPRALLESHQGKLALLDGTTQLRVGVQRPRVILPEVT